MDFGDYVHQRRPALMRFATVLTGQAWLADDLVSDVLARAFERWDHIAGLDQPHAYVRRMIVNEFLSFRRRRRRTAPHEDVEPYLPELGDGAEQRAERELMLARLSQLPRKQRAAVVLRYYAGLSDAEIASELGCRDSTVRSQIARALATLRLQDDAGQPIRPVPDRAFQEIR